MNYIIQLGGIFAILTLIHFLIDWIPQSHDEAMAKSTNSKVRAIHCLIYCLGFIPVFILCHLPLLIMVLNLAILFASHYCEDTYIPVMMWAKYIRKAPEFKFSKTRQEEIDSFIEFASTPLGKILLITVDQIIHLLFLIIIAIIILTFGI